MSGPAPTAGPAEVALAQATWQPVLLARRPRRMDLLRLRAGWPVTPVSVRVHRNHGFDVVTAVWRPFCAWAGLDVRAQLGAYDDSLDLADATVPADLHVVSLDFDRYRPRMSGAELCDWFLGRLTELAGRTGAPVLATNWAAPDPEAADFNDRLSRGVDELPGVVVGDVAAVADELGTDFADHRLSGVSGTPWSAAAAVAVAREFGLRWLPALLCPPVKAVVVDLDGTLYDGVLGEDGAAGVKLTDAHVALQRHLVSLRERGVFLAVVSRNERADVDELFRLRTDFPLRGDMLSASAVSWASKADAVEDVARRLGIGVDALAVLDDNPGELATVRSAHPGVRTLHAPDPRTSLQALVHCPGLFRFGTTVDDALRVGDLAAAQDRTAQLQAATDPEAYQRSLHVEVEVRRDRLDDVPRAAQLFARTNQFTTSLARTTERELRRGHDDGSSTFVTASLRDRLADSGTVAAVVAHREGRRLVVEDVAISCRALGRQVETAVVEAALQLLAGDDVEQLEFRYVTGPRNRPAREWLAGYCGAELATEGVVTVDWSPQVVGSGAAQRSISIVVGGRHDAG